MVFTARLVDKLCAALPGGHSNDYLPTTGFSALWAHYTKIDLNALSEIVARASTEGEIATWIEDRTNDLNKEAINEKLERFASARTPPELRDEFERIYPVELRARYPTMFDLLEADDERLYPASVAAGTSAATVGAVTPGTATLIEALGLRAHPEGGYYRETFRSEHLVDTPRGPRSALTTILFLLTAESFSAFHRIASDEAWHFYDGDAIAIEILHPGGAHERRDLGPGGSWQTVVPGGAAFASHVLKPGGHALVGCDVAPGFEFADFELCKRSELLATYPAAAAIISSLTRG